MPTRPPTHQPAAHEQGFSLVEAMLSAAAFSIVVTSFAGALILGQQATLGSGQRARAANLAEEGIESVRSIRDQAFNELQYTQSGVQVASNTWAFLGEGTTETIDEFTRTISFADVCRNGSYVIAACPATYTDPHSKQVTVTVTWPVGPGATTGSVSRVSYLTDWESTSWTQTNWFGGSGQSTWSDATKYDTDDGNVTVSTAGQVTLKSLSGDGNPWWNTGYGYREKITFGTSHSLLKTGYTSTLTMDTRTTATHVLLASGNDVRIVWQPTAGQPVELDRIGTTWNNAATAIDFRLQSDITANLNEDADGSYYVYYGNASAGTPPTNEMNVYYFADFFNRSDSTTIGNGWTEWTTGGGNVSIATNAASVVGNNTGPADAGIKQTFPLGALPGNFTLQFDWTLPSNSEATWTHYLNIGNSATMTDASRTTGVGPGIYTGEGAQFSPNGTENVSNDLTGNMETGIHGGPYAIKLVVNTTAQTYDYYRAGVLRATAQTYATSQSTLNQIRIATDQYAAGQPAFVYDNLRLTLDVATTPTVAASTEQALATTTLVDDTKTEFDAGTYTSNTQYNTGTNLVDLTAGGKTAGTGTYTSKIQDAGMAAIWQTFGWTPNRPTGKELPNNGATETGYPTGNMAMTSNWGLYHLNESAGATSFADSSGNSRTGTCVSSSSECPTAGTGEFNGAFAFDGSSNRVTLSTAAISGSALTLSAWVKETSLPSGNPEVVSRDTSGNVYIWSLGFTRVSSTTAKVRFRIRTGSTTTTLSGSTTYTIGSWMHIVGVYNGSTMTVYKDGVSDGSVAKTGTLSASAATTLIGDQTPDAEVGFIGSIDEVGVWSRALSATEVSDMYKRGALNLKYQVRSCDDAACAGESFAGPDGTGSTYYTELGNSTTTTPSFVLTNVPTNRYFQYQATLTTANTTLTPEIQSVSVTYPSGSGGGTGYATAGSLQSSAFNMTDSSPVESVEWDQSVPSCSPACTIKLQVRTAPNAAGSPGTWSAWYGATGSGTYFTANTGTRIPLALNGNQWVQYRVELAGDGTDSPILQEVRLYYR